MEVPPVPELPIARRAPHHACVACMRASVHIYTPKSRIEVFMLYARTASQGQRAGPPPNPVSPHTHLGSTRPTPLPRPQPPPFPPPGARPAPWIQPSLPPRTWTRAPAGTPSRGPTTMVGGPHPLVGVLVLAARPLVEFGAPPAPSSAPCFGPWIDDCDDEFSQFDQTMAAASFCVCAGVVGCVADGKKQLGTTLVAFFDAGDACML